MGLKNADDLRLANALDKHKCLFAKIEDVKRHPHRESTTYSVHTYYLEYRDWYKRLVNGIK